MRCRCTRRMAGSDELEVSWVLAVVRSLGSARRLGSPPEIGDFEQELVDQFGLALARSLWTAPIDEFNRPLQRRFRRAASRG